MPHVRQQIRAAAADVLTGLTTTGTSVFVSRAHPVNADSLPCLRLYCAAEELVPELSAMGGKRGYRLQLVVEALARPVAGADDQLDTICAEVQTALMDDDTLGGLAEDLELMATDFEFDDESESATGQARMTYACVYRIDRTDPLTAIT